MLRFDHFNLDNLVKLVNCKTIDKALELLRDPKLEREVEFFVADQDLHDLVVAHAIVKFTVFDILEFIVDDVAYVVDQYTGELTGARFTTSLLRCDVDADGTAVYIRFGSRVTVDKQAHEFYKILCQALRESYIDEA